MNHMHFTGKKVQTKNSAQGPTPSKEAGGPDAYAPTPISQDIQVPDRGSIDPDSPYKNALQGRSVGIKLDGKLRPNDVIEYCVSEGWIRIAARLANGKIRKERGKKVLVKITGTVEAFWRSK